VGNNPVGYLLAKNIPSGKYKVGNHPVENSPGFNLSKFLIRFLKLCEKFNSRVSQPSRPFIKQDELDNFFRIFVAPKGNQGRHQLRGEFHLSLEQHLVRHCLRN